MNAIQQRIQSITERLAEARDKRHYFFLQSVERLDGAWVELEGRRMLMMASYGYLNLLQHPHINAAAQEAVARYGTGTHGVRLLAGTLPLHQQLEQTIARFKGCADAIVYSSGYVTNLATISTLVGRNDVVISDKLNHASIVDGCLLSGAQFLRFAHNDMCALERCLQRAGEAAKLVVVDAVFSMDGDIIDLPNVVRLCREYDALLMIDEAHSLGVLGATGRGIEEHFGMPGVIDVKMGTLSKTIPSIGGYVAGEADLIAFLKHAARGFIFSAALPPAQVAAAQAAFEVIVSEPERVAQLQRNVTFFLAELHARGFDTLNSSTPIVPIICGSDELAYKMSRSCQDRDIFVLPIVSPAVPSGLARLRVNVTAAHTQADITLALDVIEEAGHTHAILK